MIIQNRISEFEFEICSILAQLAYHIHPAVVERIKAKNLAEYDYFSTLFRDKIDVSNYLFDGSACVFPGVRRYIAAQGAKRRYNPSYQAIIDDNVFPRYIWSFLLNGRAYSGPSWKETGLGEFELAHVFTHKKSEIEFEKQFFDSMQSDLRPHSDFTCACNVVLLPKGTVRPTDNSKAIKAAFFMRYVELYGEDTLIGRSGFKNSEVPSWYGDLGWNQPCLPPDWKENIDRLLKYRTNRITHILSK